MIIAAINTGMVESWAAKIADMGPIYPFVGSEVLHVIIGVVLWILWHVWQTRNETRHHREQMDRFK